VELTPEIFGTKFDVILIDPPWEEYVRRAPGMGDEIEWWTPLEIMALRIEAIADTPSFVFLWVGDAEGLEYGRMCLKKWGFRRCEDICWVKTNREKPDSPWGHTSETLFQHSKEHCLMGIRGTVRRSTDGHVIHANIDTDVLISEQPPFGSTEKPEELYSLIEHFALGRRRIELFGADHNIRAGWLTVGKSLTSSNFNPQDAFLHAVVFSVAVVDAPSVPLPLAFDLWMDRELIPSWMPWIASVKVRDDKPELSTWTLHYTAFGQNFEFSWLAKNLQPIHHQKIHWRSLDGLPNSGAVRFFPSGPNGCKLEMTISYEVPGILVPVANSLAPLVQSIIQADLERFVEYAKKIQQQKAK
ncbi:unnamed protein product, partial [Closterium sp. Naga37s-1]